MRQCLKPWTRKFLVGRDWVALTVWPDGRLETRVLRHKKSYSLTLAHVFWQSVKAQVECERKEKIAKRKAGMA